MKNGVIPIEIDFQKESGKWFLRIYIYCNEHPVSLDDCENLTNSIDNFLNEIIPVLEMNLAKNNQHKRYSHEFLFDTWVRVAICEADAYSFQGNDKSLEVINTIEDVLKKAGK